MIPDDTRTAVARDVELLYRKGYNMKQTETFLRGKYNLRVEDLQQIIREVFKGDAYKAEKLV